VFIIARGLYFGLGARLIIAYNAQGETRHHLTVATDSRPIHPSGYCLGFGQGGRWSCPCLGVLTPLHVQTSAAPPQPVQGLRFSGRATDSPILFSTCIFLMNSPPTLQPSSHPGSWQDRGSKRKEDTWRESDLGSDSTQVSAPLWASVSPVGLWTCPTGSEIADSETV
jgi:hypothetical protein